MFRSVMAVLAAAPMLLGLPAAAGTGPPAVSCAAIAGQPFALATVTSATTVTNSRSQEYCEVRGVIQPQTHFAIKLPTSGWTGQYVQQGCSGLCGSVPALDLPLFGFGCAPAIDGKLVLAADDSGHTGTDQGDGRWGADPRLRVVFGLTSEHSLQQVATAVMRAYYGRGPAYRYFDGCSTGGRQGLNLAQRYPADFDGILGGAPANNLAPLGLLNAWTVVRNTDSAGRQILGADKVPALHEAVARACGEIIDDPRACGFQPASIQCPAGVDTPSCLTPAQVAAVTAFYRGPTDARGRSLYNGGVPYGSELSWVNQFVDPDGHPEDTLSGRIALSYFRYLAYPQNPPAGFTLADVRFTEAEFDRVNLLGDAIYNANDPDLSAFRARGGKLILYHGWADAAIPPFSTTDYYAAVERRAGGFAASQRFSRLYLIPAGYHCLFGPDPYTPAEVGFVEFLTPLMDWVERGIAPGPLDAPTLSAADFSLVRDLTIAPVDALGAVHAAPGSLNANYDYVGGY
ncbi:MAG TPA: tannase/feruloyl esterase family alpha/beta hydrolase [Actinoplanes sp.]|nr:tannase/feruloyl esterase family alpha/beta hydrolase [Actinoplanes sp.]